MCVQSAEVGLWKCPLGELQEQGFGWATSHGSVAGFFPGSSPALMAGS